MLATGFSLTNCGSGECECLSVSSPKLQAQEQEAERAPRVAPRPGPRATSTTDANADTFEVEHAHANAVLKEAIAKADNQIAEMERANRRAKIHPLASTSILPPSPPATLLDDEAERLQQLDEKAALQAAIADTNRRIAEVEQANLRQAETRLRTSRSMPLSRLPAKVDDEEGELRRQLELDPTDSTVLYRLSKILIDRGDIVGANALYAQSRATEDTAAPYPSPQDATGCVGVLDPPACAGFARSQCMGATRSVVAPMCPVLCNSCTTTAPTLTTTTTTADSTICNGSKDPEACGGFSAAQCGGVTAEVVRALCPAMCDACPAPTMGVVMSCPVGGASHNPGHWKPFRLFDGIRAVAQQLASFGSTVKLVVAIYENELDQTMPQCKALAAEVTTLNIVCFVIPEPFPGGYGVSKVVAVKHAPVDLAIWFDCDLFPTVDPAILLDDPEFQQTGAMFWADLEGHFHYHDRVVPYLESNVPTFDWELFPKSAWWSRSGFDSGILVVDKRKAERPLNRLYQMATQWDSRGDVRSRPWWKPEDEAKGPAFYKGWGYLTNGDKDLWHLAWMIDSTNFT